MSWRIDPEHTSVMFAVTHSGLVDMRGIFRVAEGAVEFDRDAGLPTAVALALDVGSLHSGSDARDQHVRSERFLDEETFPQIRFTSRSVAPAAAGRCRIEGDLQVHGVSRPLTLDVAVVGPVRSRHGTDVVGLRTETLLDRRDFGLTGAAALENGALITGERVRVAVDLEAVEAE